MEYTLKRYSGLVSVVDFEIQVYLEVHVCRGDGSHRVNIAIWKALGELTGIRIVMVEVSALAGVHAVAGLRWRTLIDCLNDSLFVPGKIEQYLYCSAQQHKAG